MTRSLEYERVCPPLYKVADTPFHIQGNDVHDNMVHTHDNVGLLYSSKLMQYGNFFFKYK